MRIEASVTIERPVSVVWDFYAVRQIENHPRWDPSIELEATADGPIGVGTVIERRANRFGRVTDGTMEVTAFEPETVMRVRTQDGPVTTDGWALFDAIGEHETRLTIGGEIPGIDRSAGARIKTMIERSAATIKALVEAEEDAPT